MQKLNRITFVFLILFSVTLYAQNPHAESGLVKGIVQEVIQVSSYTYLNVLEEDGTKRWLAVPSMEASASGNSGVIPVARTTRSALIFMGQSRIGSYA